MVKRWCGSGVGRMVADVCEREREREWMRADASGKPVVCWRCVALSYIGAAEMAQGLGSGAGSRKWRGAVVGDGSGAGPSLFSFLLRRTWAASCFITFMPCPNSSSPSRLIPSRGGTLARLSSSRSDTSSPSFHQVLAKRYILAKLPSGPRQAIHPRQASIRSSRSICPLEVVSGISLEGQIAWRGK